MPNYTIYFDGYSSPHKHNRAGYIFYVEDEHGSLVTYTVKDLDPYTTNNVAEATGLLEALKWFDDSLGQKLGYQTPFSTKTSLIRNPTPIRTHSTVRVLGDSKLIIDGYNKRLIKRTNLKTIIDEARRIGTRYPGLEVKWIPREWNKAGLLLEKGEF